MSERAMPTRGPVKVMIEAGDEWWFGHGDEITLRPASGIGCALAVMHADEQSIANFDLFAAAINASREAADLGFDPIAAVEQLPAFIEACVNFAHGRKESRECEREMMGILAAARVEVSQ